MKFYIYLVVGGGWSESMMEKMCEYDIITMSTPNEM